MMRFWESTPRRNGLSYKMELAEGICLPLEIRKGTELHDQYVISDLLGIGGYAAVWRATDRAKSRDVAIKRMLKRGGGELERLLEEAKKTRQLQGHKNIVEMYEVFEEDGEGFLVMEYVDGSTLDDIFRQHIRSGTWIDPDEAADYFKQILQGLLFAHSSGVYHRDIKPSNILVSRLGVVKLVDFGLAKQMIPVGSESSLHENVGMARTGTANFMSPEQANGEHLDHMTDIFSAGIVGHLLFTKRHSFNHPSGSICPRALHSPSESALSSLTEGSSQAKPGSLISSKMLATQRIRAVDASLSFSR